MVRRHILIIVNPAAGRARSSERRLGRFVAALERQGCTVVLRRAGPSPGQVERLAGQAEPGFDAIVAAGGDGTISAVVNGLGGRAVPFGVLPLGSANVLAREIRLPRAPEALASLVVTGPASPIWPGRVGNRAFVMMASAGFDSEIVAALSPELKRRVGRLAFAWGFLVRLWHCPACELTVRADGVEYRAAAVVAAKGRHYAGPFVVAPGADLAEPVLELVLLDRRGRWAMLRYATALFLGRVPRLGDIAIVRARQASVAGNRALPVQADGEIVGELPITLAVADRPLLLIRPAG
ncbi:MAG: diacylglycerol kinase family lipid kinase [Alphaproteobacteria bacterium]|nr:MAG: diacylglycerol kinase family lipid kinase [Alphaproteobacteria bacterium]